jgi:hypothetical protein
MNKKTHIGLCFSAKSTLSLVACALLQIVALEEMPGEDPSILESSKHTSFVWNICKTSMAENFTQTGVKKKECSCK